MTKPLIWHIDEKDNQSTVKIERLVTLGYIDFEENTVEIITTKPIRIDTLKRLLNEYEPSKDAYFKKKLIMEKSL